MSGIAVADTGELGDIGVAALLVVTNSPGIAGVVAVKVGVWPTVLLFGVTGTLNVEAVPLAIGPGFVQETVDTAVLQLQPLFAKLLGAVTPAGKVTFVVIAPTVGAVPTLETVTGILLTVLTIIEGVGCPMAVTKSGEPDTGKLTGVAALLPVAVSFGTALVEAVNG